MSLRGSPHSGGYQPAANPQSSACSTPPKTNHALFFKYSQVEPSLSGGISCVAAVLVQKLLFFFLSEFWHCLASAGGEDGVVWAKGVRFGWGGGDLLEMRRAWRWGWRALLTAACVGPLQASELKTHTGVYSQLAGGWFIHCARCWVTCCTETLPS